MKKKVTAIKASAKKTPNGAKPLAKSKANSGKDIIELILKDHKPLKKLIKVLISKKADKSEKKTAFTQFARLLLWHAEPEENVLYIHMKEDSENLRVEGYEGDIEHQLASQMINEVKASENDDQWMARVKVLAELVDHHIKEEEQDMFPDIRKAFDLEARIQMGDDYLQLRDEFEMLEVDSTPRNSFKKSKNSTEFHWN